MVQTATPRGGPTSARRTGHLEADYVIVGAGAAAMAFADTLLTDTDATMVMVDRRHGPGGHWHDAYPFVRLHSPSLTYGVNSTPLGSERLEETGFNAGLHELATGPEICAYFEQVMRRRFLPSGRVTWLPQHEYVEGDAVSRVTGARTRLHARRRLVDGTWADTRLPTTHPPAFRVADGARLAPPHALAGMEMPRAGCVIIGAGKTAMDTVVWLLEQGLSPGAITWIRPRDPWLLPRETVQPSLRFFNETAGALAAEFEAAQAAASIDDLFARLEAAGLLRRIDPAVAPTMYRCAIVSAAELDMMRRIETVVRLGHVTAIGADRIDLEGGAIAVTPDHLHINCTADGLPRAATQPIFQNDRILLQYVRRCSPTFSAALIAHVEATVPDDAEKNRLCRPVPVPTEPLDWLRMHLADASNRAAWAGSPELRTWLREARLDGFTAMFARAGENPTPAQAAILKRYREAAQPGLARMSELLQGVD